jgi:phosphatidylglycerophosphatase A
LPNPLSVGTLKNVKDPWRRYLAVACATGLGSGYFPFAPGTAGALVGLVFVAWLDASWWVLTLFSILLFFVGVWSGGAVSQIWKTADPSRVVIDEVVGMMVTMIGIPVSGYFVLLGFILFRIFDIWKPVPANYFEVRLPGGWGIMADDLVAGIYGNVILHLVVRSQL